MYALHTISFPDFRGSCRSDTRMVLSHYVDFNVNVHHVKLPFPIPLSSTLTHDDEADLLSLTIWKNPLLLAAVLVWEGVVIISGMPSRDLTGGNLSRRI